MANRNFANGGKIYSMHSKLVAMTCKFTVSPADSAGNGVTTVTGPGLANVFMHTTATASATNPNPASGLIYVQAQDNYSRLLLTNATIISPNSGTPLTSVTAGNAYVITALGTATAAQWIAVGVNPAVIAMNSNGLPTLQTSFIATSTGTIGGSAAVQAPSQSGITSVEVVGDPNQSIATFGTPGLGAQLILQCLNNTTLTAPAAGSTIELELFFLDTSVASGAAYPGN